MIIKNRQCVYSSTRQRSMCDTGKSDEGERERGGWLRCLVKALSIAGSMQLPTSFSVNTLALGFVFDDILVKGRFSLVSFSQVYSW